MNTLLLKYKNMISALVTIFVLGFGLLKFHSFYEERIEGLNKQIAEIEEKIRLAKEIQAKEAQIASLRGKFIPLDSYEFISLISGFIQEANLEIASLKPSSRSYGSSGRNEEGVVQRVILQLNTEGGFDDLTKFLKTVNQRDLNITISSMTIRRKDNEDKVRADIEITGLALNE
ncbi:MAG: hypothetical protein JW734_03280 [Candidatus Omnitrophica bacterium]|nr:hypothetical protein [Candidatus Omnitrophota bacterium]